MIGSFPTCEKELNRSLFVSVNFPGRWSTGRSEYTVKLSICFVERSSPYIFRDWAGPFRNKKVRLKSTFCRGSNNRVAVSAVDRSVLDPQSNFQFASLSIPHPYIFLKATPSGHVALYPASFLFIEKSSSSEVQTPGTASQSRR